MEQDQLKKVLIASGKLALAAQSVINSTSLNLSIRIVKLEEAFNVYDNEVKLLGKDLIKNKN